MSAWLWAIVEPTAWRPDPFDGECAYLYGRTRTRKGRFRGVVPIPRALLAEDFAEVVAEAQGVLASHLAEALHDG